MYELYGNILYVFTLTVVFLSGGRALHLIVLLYSEARPTQLCLADILTPAIME